MAIKATIALLALSASLLGNEPPSSEGWESTHFVWNFGLITTCDVGFPQNPRPYFANEPPLQPECYQNIESGDIVWVPSRFLSEFYQKVFPGIQVPFVLVISDGDASFPSDCLKADELEEMLSHENLIHIFAQNCDYRGTSKKISHIPIGIDFHTVAYKGTAGGWGMIGSPKQQEDRLLHYFQTALPTSQRKCRAFVDFQHSDTMHGDFKRYLQFGEDRASIFNTLARSGVIDHSSWMKRGELWKTKVNYAFSISPHGNGLDCHRTWEDLILGCIVIVKSSPLDPLYEGLPVVIVQNWDEITEENLQKWIIQYADASTNHAYREKLTHQYWMSKIINTAYPFKSHAPKT